MREFKSRRLGPMTRAAVVAVSVSVVGSLGGCNTGSSGAKTKSESVITMWSPPTPAEAAAWAVDPYDADKRQRGILLLANAPFGGEPVYVDLYAVALQDGDAGVRTAAIKALGLHGSPENVPDMLPMLEDEDRLLRWETAVALQRLHNEVAIIPLIGRLDIRKETESEVRAAAATALGQYTTRSSLDGLIGSLDDHDLSVNLASERSLTTLTGKRLGADRGVWMAWVRESEDPFAEAGVYEYPVFERDRTFLEWVVPWMEPPNEIAAAPPGYDPPEVAP